MLCCCVAVTYRFPLKANPQPFTRLLPLTVISMTETHLVLIGLLLVADWQVGSVDIQVDVVVTSDAPTTLPSSRHPLQLHLDVVALLPLLAHCGQAEDATIHIHRPQQGCWHGCTSNLERCVKEEKSI